MIKIMGDWVFEALSYDEEYSGIEVYKLENDTLIKQAIEKLKAILKAAPENRKDARFSDTEDFYIISYFIAGCNVQLYINKHYPSTPTPLLIEDKAVLIRIPDEYLQRIMCNKASKK